MLNKWGTGPKASAATRHKASQKPLVTRLPNTLSDQQKAPSGKGTEILLGKVQEGGCGSRVMGCHVLVWFKSAPSNSQTGLDASNFLMALSSLP